MVLSVKLELIWLHVWALKSTEKLNVLIFDWQTTYIFIKYRFMFPLSQRFVTFQYSGPNFQ